MGQMTLGEMIAAMEPLADRERVYFDFGGFVPASLCSWRGSYDQLAIIFGKGTVTAQEFLDKLKGAVGNEYTGWKGGENTMSNDTPVWAVSEWGSSGWTAIHKIVDCGWYVVIETRHYDYGKGQPYPHRRE